MLKYMVICLGSFGVGLVFVLSAKIPLINARELTIADMMWIVGGERNCYWCSAPVHDPAETDCNDCSNWAFGSERCDSSSVSAVHRLAKSQDPAFEICYVRKFCGGSGTLYSSQDCDPDGNMQVISTCVNMYTDAVLESVDPKRKCPKAVSEVE